MDNKLDATNITGEAAPMKKLPRSGPLFDTMFEAVSEVQALGNTAGTPGGVNEGESLEQIYKRVAEKYKVPLDLLKKADNNFDDVFESRMIEAPYKGLGEMSPAAKAAQQAPYERLIEQSRPIDKRLFGKMSPASKAAQQAPYERLIEQSRPIDKRLFGKMSPAGKLTPKGVLSKIAKFAGPVSEAFTAYELISGLGEAKKLGESAIARQVAAENAIKEKMGREPTQEEKDQIYNLIRKSGKMRANPELREGIEEKQDQTASQSKLSPEERLKIKELIKLKKIPSGSYPYMTP